MTVIERMARAILCPDIPARMGNRVSLEDARAVVWKMSSPTKQANAIRQATAAVEALLPASTFIEEAIQNSIDWNADIAEETWSRAIEAVLREAKP